MLGTRDTYRNTPAEWPIALDELKARRDACKKRENIVSFVWLVVFFGLLFGNIPLAEWITEQQKTYPWLGITYGVVFFGLLFGNVFAIFWIQRQRMRAYDLVCPACGTLMRGGLIPLAITTGRCGACGAELVVDHPALYAAPSPPEDDEQNL